MMRAILFSRHRFDSGAKAAGLLKFIGRFGGAFAPALFGTVAPLRKAYDSDDLTEPARLLFGGTGRGAGYVRLKGAKNEFEAGFGWNKSEIIKWDIELGEEFFDDEKRVEEFTGFVTELCRRFSVLYGGAAPEEDWQAKHSQTERLPDGGEIYRQVGLSLEGCLPGVYWMTIFGEAAVAHFGRKKLENLPVHRVFDLGDNGLALVLRESPFEPELEKRLRQDGRVVRQLGREYFFDLRNPKKDCHPVPGVTQPKAPEEEEQEEGSARPTEDFEKFERQIILSPEGKSYTQPQQMAEDTVVYFHPKIKEIFDYSRNSLQALDEYLSAHPQYAEYTREHLFKELIPALGSYLGEVLVKRLGGKWVKRQPILKSSVKVNTREVAPFWYGFHAVYGDAKLADVFDAAKGRRR